MAIIESEWKVVERPGWFGEARDGIIAGYNQKYGEGNWRLRHVLGMVYLDVPQSMLLYEHCYEAHFLNPDNRYLWNRMIKTAKDVWMELESDVESGMDYSIQKAPANHYEDVAIRIILKKYGLSFKGDKLMRIRADSDDTIGIALSSIHVPFVHPQYIEPDFPEIYWWNRHKGSLEHFWHNNKVLQVKIK